uniref:Protein POLAR LOCALIZATION DURING ASYMMETRIC DIVISION AND REDISTRIBUTION n=1 Tax=Aegilops tauschii TaxID=37682 RepID=R7WB21_AEGTA
MASAGGGGIDGAAGTTTKKKKRISDCLVDSDGGDEVAGEDAMPPSPPSPGTPRLRIPMFTCARLRFVRLGRKGGAGRKDQFAAEKSEAASTDSSAAGWKAASSGASSTETAGMGLSLLFLLAKTCVELNKMAEVRAEMEGLLREMRDQLVVRTTKVATTTDSPCQCQASSSTRTDGQDAGATSSSSPEPARRRHFRRDRRAGRKRRDGPFYALTGNPLFDLEREPCGRAAASSSAMETASGASETSSEVEDPSSSMAVDVAGAQLQLNCRTEQGTPESSSDGESFIELDGGFGAGAGRGGYSARRWRDSEDGQEEAEEERGDEGVPALELERRLQELLHRRSRERIEELEASLRHAERKVMEKEMEARLWKDTAKLALQPGTRGDVLAKGLSRGAIATRKKEGINRDKGHGVYTGSASYGEGVVLGFMNRLKYDPAPPGGSY